MQALVREKKIYIWWGLNCRTDNQLDHKPYNGRVKCGGCGWEYDVEII